MFNNKYFYSILFFFFSSLVNAQEPVIHLKLNEGGGITVFDKSGNDNNGTLHGGDWINNNELKFDGSDDYIDVTDDSTLDLTDELTISVWIRPESFSKSTYEGIVHKKLSGANNATSYGLFVNYDTQHPRFYLATTNGEKDLLGNTELIKNQWQHLTVTYKSGDARIYLNGSLDSVTTSISGSIQPSNENLTIGKRLSHFFDGQIAEVQIFGKVLSEKEINELITEPGDWRINAGSGQAIGDSAHSFNPGTIHGANWNSNDSSRGTVLEFDGVDDYIEIKDSHSLDATEAITIMAWVKPDTFTTSSYEGIVHKSNNNYGSQNTVYGLTVNWVTSEPRFFLSTSDGEGQSLVGSSQLTAGEWQHVAVTYTSGDARIYINGELDRIDTTITGTISTSSDPVTIGKRHNYYFDGAIDDVAIYKRVLSAREIKTAYSQVGQWDMEEGVGNYIADQSRSFNSATLIGPSWENDAERGSFLRFNGTSDFAQIDNSASLDITDEITILAWVKPHSFSNQSYDGIVHKFYAEDESQNTAYGLSVNWDTAHPRFYFSTSTGYGKDIMGNTPLVANQWQHIAVTYKPGETRMYRNGQSDGSNSTHTGTLVSSDAPITIGKRKEHYFDGDIDEVRIYNRALSEDEIEWIYNNYSSTVYVVPAITDHKILPDTYISEGNISEEINLMASPGEYSPASFVIAAHEDLNDVTVAISDLVSGANTIDSDSVDLRVVKNWYQYPDWNKELGKYLTPELLLKNDSLIKLQAGKNRLFVNGLYVDISDPEGIAGIDDQPSVDDFNVQDANTLQPVDLTKGTNKQFWVTVEISESAVAGDYQGTILLTNAGGTVKALDLNVKVLPIALADPDVEYSIYNSSRLKTAISAGTISGENKNPSQYAAELENLLSHGVSNPNVYGANDSLTDVLTMRSNAGISNRRLYYLGVVIDPENSTQASVQANITNLQNEISTYTGDIGDLYVMGKDEQPLNSPHARGLIEAAHEMGVKVFNAQKIEDAANVFDILDLAVANSVDGTLAASYHDYGNKIGSYANPQAGLEKPETYRRNYGLLIWQNDYDVVMDWAYQGGHKNIWNDFDYTVYRDEVFTYPTANGVIDTIQWEGFREGVDDMRYLSTLIDLADQAGTEGQEARDWLENLKSKDLNGVNLDHVRNKMIQYILDLSN